MPTIISRAQAGLPPVPSSIGTRSLSSWTGIKVHHTGGGFSSWRAIYDWQVRNRPPGERLVDIGYSFGIANGRVTELRGWNKHPAHDHENSTIGVVLGGNYTSRLPSKDDMDALVWFCQEARRKTGKKLKIDGHRDTWPRGDRRYSTCPGDALYRWLPTLRARVDDNEEDDMPYTPAQIRQFAKEGVAELLGISSKDYLIANLTSGGRIPFRTAVEMTYKRANQIAAVVGDDEDTMRQVVREELAGLADQLGPALVAELREAAGDLPAEAVEGAVARALARTSLTVAPGDDES